jgi:DnaA family protein
MQQLILELAPPPAPTLDNFFPGRNAAAVASLRESTTDGERFVYLWGAPGSGRSHLLKGFAHDCGGTYVEDPQFDCPPDAAAVAIDDIDRLDIVGQLAVFDLYNSLRQRRGTLIAAGNRPPADLPLREDLRTRVGSGIVLQLHPLSESEKREALTRHAEARGLRIGDDVFDFLLSRFARDMGTQVAVLDALDRLSLQTQRAPTLTLLREALKSESLACPPAAR